ncbi:MAG: hypothetical protein MI794_15640 [Pseudomonadales bacterium]|nr:hypothetical protein [Pseudomonadales bacterium]
MVRSPSPGQTPEILLVYDGECPGGVGADAIHTLALISGRSGLFNRFNYWLFRSSRRAALVYSVLRSCRNLLLKLLRKTRINNLGLPDNDRF